MKYATVIIKSDQEWVARSEAEREFEPLGPLNVHSTAEAIETVRSWPTRVGVRIEVRPIVEN
jgi:hypothetical protein